MTDNLVHQVSCDLLLLVSDDHYHIRLVAHQKIASRIDSEHRIVYVRVLTEMGRVAVVDAKMNWAVYQIGKEGSLEQYCSGHIVEEKEQMSNVVWVGEVEHNLFFVLDGFHVVYCPFPINTSSTGVLCR